MNRVFFWLIACAFLATAARELLYVIPLATDPNSTLAWAQSFVNAGTDAKGGELAPMDLLTNAAFDSAKAAVELALKFVGGMTLFLGLMKCVEVGGGLNIIARLIRPLMVWIFPDVPANHPAMGAMIMNLSANALGLGNAATPFGIKAMQELDKLNKHRGIATNAMALFLTINTSSVTLLATGVIVQRRELGSLDAAAIQMTTLFATVCSTACGIIACKILERFFADPPGNDPVDIQGEDIEPGYPLWVSAAVLAGFLLVFAGVLPAAAVWYPPLVNGVTRWLIPALITGFLAFGYFRGVAVYEAFVEGARDGFGVATRIIPYLVAILVAVAMFRSSGALDALTGLVGPITSRFGLPAEALPMALIRPLSGSGASGVMMDTMKTYGPDSYVGYLVSTIQGSSETTFYVLAVYYGAVGVKGIRHTLPAALIAELCGLIGSIISVTAYWKFVLGN